VQRFGNLGDKVRGRNQVDCLRALGNKFVKDLGKTLRCDFSAKAVTAYFAVLTVHAPHIAACKKYSTRTTSARNNGLFIVVQGSARNHKVGPHSAPTCLCRSVCATISWTQSAFFVEIGFHTINITHF
jgi:hypothetical protein